MATSARTKSESITKGQIGQITDRLTTKLRDSGLPSEAVQLVLAAPGGRAIAEMVAVFRKHVEANSNQIVRIVTVNATRDARAALEATGYALYVNNNVVNAMPRGEGGTTEVVPFNPETWEYTGPGYMNDEDLDKAFERRNLNASDPFSLAAVIEDKPSFAYKRPIATHWKDANGKWCFAEFRRWNDKRSVGVDRGDRVWNDRWSFVGVRKRA